MVKKKKTITKKTSRKRIVKKTKIRPAKKDDKKKTIASTNEPVEGTEQDHDDWEEFKNENKKDDEVKFEDLEGFEFEDETYAEPEDKGGGKEVQAEEVFDDEP